jgi:hypothetical protein
MRKIYLLLLLAITTQCSIAADVYWNNTVITGNWSTAANWVGGVAPTNTDNVFFLNATGVIVTIDGTFSPTTINIDGGTPTFTATAARTLTAFNGLFIKNGGVLTVTGSATITLTCAGGASLIDNGCSLIFTGTGSGGSRLNCSGGTTTFNGTLRYNTLSGNTSGVTGLAFGATGLYQVDKNGGTIPAAAYNVNSTILITGTGANPPTFGSGLNVVFPNIEYNSPTVSGALNLGFGSGNSIGGNLKLTNVNNQLVTLATTPPNPFAIGGNVEINNGTLRLSNSATSITVNLNGNLTIATGTTLDLQGSSGNNTLNIKGNINALGTITEVGTSTTSKIVLNGTTNQNVSFSNTSFSNDVSLTINNAAGITALTDINLSAGVNAKLTFTSGNIDVKTNSKFLSIQNPQSNAIVGGSTTSHVIGQMKRNSNQIAGYSFPVSDIAAELKRAIVTTNATTSTQWVVEFIPSNTNSTTSLPLTTNGDLLEITSSYYWDIQRSAGGSDASNVTLFYDFASSGIYNSGSVKIAHWTGSVWESFGGIDATGSIDNSKGTTGAAAPTDPITNFSPFTFGGTIIALPLTISTIKAEATGATNTISWTTATESNNSKFVVERSIDGTNFTTVGDVATRAINGNSNTVLNYNFVDVNPTQGKAYYRLQMVDNNSTVKYSQIVTVRRGAGKLEIVDVRPNPTTGTLYFNVLGATSNLNVLVCDLSGKVVIKKGLLQNGNFNIDMSQLSGGIYMLEAIDVRNGEKAMFKIVKQ